MGDIFMWHVLYKLNCVTVFLGFGFSLVFFSPQVIISTPSLGPKLTTPISVTRSTNKDSQVPLCCFYTLLEFFFSIFIWRYTSHNKTHYHTLKVYSMGLLVYLLWWATVATICFRTFPSSRRKVPYLLAVSPQTYCFALCPFHLIIYCEQFSHPVNHSPKAW